MRSLINRRHFKNAEAKDQLEPKCVPPMICGLSSPDLALFQLLPKLSSVQTWIMIIYWKTCWPFESGDCLKEWLINNEHLVFMPTLSRSLDTAWEKSLQQLWLPIMLQAFILLTDLNSDCSGFQFQSWFAFMVIRATLLRADPANPGGMAAIVASEKVGHYIF